MNFGIKNRKKPEDEGSILSCDFRTVEKNQKLWEEKREKKGEFYAAISNYINFLEGILTDEVDPYQKLLLKKELKELRKLLKKYYVPSVLEMANYELCCREIENIGALEGSSFSLVRGRGKVKVEK